MGKGTHKGLLPLHLRLHPQDIFLKPLRHIIKAAAELAKFILCTDIRTDIQIACGYFSCRPGQLVQMLCQYTGQCACDGNSQQHHDNIDHKEQTQLHLPGGIHIGCIKPGLQQHGILAHLDRADHLQAMSVFIMDVHITVLLRHRF